MSWNLPGEPRYGVHSIDHFALEVPALADAEKFFTLFGLKVLATRVGLRSEPSAIRCHGATSTRDGASASPT